MKPPRRDDHGRDSAADISHGWGLHSLWKANAPKCVVGIVDTVFIADGKPETWLFTAKTGEVLRKKAFQPADIVDRFSRIALANDANVNAHVAVVRRSNGSCLMWDLATIAQAAEVPLDKHVVAIQPFVCSRGSLGSVYRHEIKTVMSNDHHPRFVHATSKMVHHQMSSSGPSVLVDAPRPDQALKSNATAINSRLHGITTLVRQHLEELHNIRIHEIAADFIIDANEQIWLVWIPSVAAKGSPGPVDAPSASPPPRHLSMSNNGWLATSSDNASMEQLVFDAAEDTVLDTPSLDSHASAKDLSSSSQLGRADAAQRRAATRFTLKPSPAPTSPAIKTGHHLTDFPTPFKCCGDFCSFDLTPPSTLAPGAADAALRRRHGIHALLSPEDSAALGAANLLQSLATQSVDMLQNYNDHRLHYTITYRSIALAKANKANLAAAEHDQHLVDDSSSSSPHPNKKSHQPSYMASTVSKDLQRSLGKTYGELDGGAANYYRHVKVCRCCFVVYSTLDTARRMLEEVAASQQGAQDAQPSTPGKDTWNHAIDETVAAKERMMMRRRSSSTSALEMKLPRLVTPPEGATSTRSSFLGTSTEGDSRAAPDEARGGGDGKHGGAQQHPQDGPEPVVMPLIHQASSPTLHPASYATSKAKKTAAKPTKHVARTWKKAPEAKPASEDVARTVEEFVGLDGYLRGKVRRRKTKQLSENALFPAGMALPSSSKPQEAYQPLILVVETDQIMINTIVALLQDDYSVDSVCDGAVALKCAQETHYDAIVCGRDVPTLGAIELTKLLRQHEIQQSIALHAPVARTPVLCFTSCTSPEDLRVYMEVGMDGCLAQPLDVDALRRTLEAAVLSTTGAPPPASLQAIVAKANQPVHVAAPLPKPAARPRKKKPPPNAGAAASSSNLANALLGHSPDDPSCTMGMFQMDADTSVPYGILNPPTAPTTVNTYFNLVIVHDIFDTLERLQIFLQPMLARCHGAQALVWNYPGQAGTTWRKGILLNNAYLSTCLAGLLTHVTAKGLWRQDLPFYLVGYGNGAPVCFHYAVNSPSPSLRAVVSINGFAHVDSTLASFLHDAMKVFSCSPASRPDLPIYFHARFLFSGAYLATVSTPLALNLYTAVSNPITLDGRVALCLGALSHADARHDLSEINVPFIAIAAAQDGLVQPLHVDAMVAARGGGTVDSIHKVLKHHRKSKTCVVWVQAGHEVFQEVKPTMVTLLEQFLTGFHETHDTTAGSPAAIHPRPDKTSLVAAAAARTSYEDHFINKVMMTLTDVKDRPDKLQPHVLHDADTTNAWTQYQRKLQVSSSTGAIPGHAKKKGPGGANGSPHAPVLDPMNPSFERDTNEVYRAGDGSKIYPDPTTRGDVKEYMQWRVQRNATRLQRMHKLASRIQKAYRAYRARTLADRLRRHKSALFIQRIYRGYKGRLRFELRRREDAAIRLVQRAWRGKMGRMQFKSTKSKRLAAIELQRMVRGWLGRLRVKRLRMLRHKSACIIQALFKRVHAIQEAWRLRRRNQAAMLIQRVYRGHVGRVRFHAERDRYLFSKAQTQNIDFGKQMLLEYKLYGTRLQSEVALLVEEKTKAEATVEALLTEIAEFEAGVRVLETEMHSLSQIETEATGVLDEQAKWQLRDQKMRLDQEFGMMLKKIADRREKLVVLGATLQALDKSRHAKEEDLRGLERKLVLLLDEQQRQLQGIKAKQEKRSQVLVDVAGGVTPPGPLGTSSGEPGAGVSCGTTVSPEQRQEANSLMESTETMMKFGFMSMSMTYFSSMNMIKAMRNIGAHHTFLDSANAIHNHATGAIAAAGDSGGGGGGARLGGGGPGGFHAEPAPGNFPGQEPLLASAWSVRDVGRWLDTLSLGQYKQAFSDGTVDGSLLYDLNDHDLRFSLGIEYDLHRKKILQTVERLKRAEGVVVDKLYSSPLPGGAATTAPAIAMQSQPQQAAAPLAQALTSPTTTPLKNAAVTMQPSAAAAAPPDAPSPLVIRFEEICSLVRNGKLKQVKEAFEKWPDKAFDPLSIKVQSAPGVGTVYEDGLEHQAFHINKGDDHGNTLLLLAAQNNLVKVCQFLVSKGANPNHQNKQGQTAGHYAMAYSFFDLGAWLLDPEKGGGRDDLANIHGLTAYDGLSPT